MKTIEKHQPWLSLFCICLIKVAIAVAQDLEGILGEEVHNEVHQFHQEGHQSLKVGPPSSLIKDKAHIQDRDHLRQHLEGTVDVDAMAANMALSEMQFHYFNSHDVDRNQRLDGLELMHSILHVDQQWVAEHPKEGAVVMTEEKLAELVDSILADDDINRDGYLDYVEFSRGPHDDSDSDFS